MFFGDPAGETNLDHPDHKHVPMQRGARFGFAGSVPMQRAARFSSKRASLEEGSWDAFLTYRSKIIFSGPPYNPLQAVYSFEQNGFIQRGSLGGPPWDAFLPHRSQTNFSGSPYNPLQADYGFEQNRFIPKGILRRTPLGRIFDLSLQKQLFRTRI
jgi:hypothetical protein